MPGPRPSLGGHFFGWLRRLSVGRKLMLIYMLDLTAVIYISGILIHEKYLAIDFARKEIVGVAYADTVRSVLMENAFAQSGDRSAAAQARERFEKARADFDDALGTGGVAPGLVKAASAYNAS